MPTISQIPDNEEEEELEDETILERIYALNEMFPQSLRNVVSSATGLTVKSLKVGYRFTRTALWYGSASFVILALPVVLEQERYGLEQMQLAQQREMILGPNAVVSGMAGSGGGLPGMAPAPPGPERR